MTATALDLWTKATSDFSLILKILILFNNILIENNYFKDNTECSIRLYNSEYVTISENNIDAGNGIDFWLADYNTILNNTIMNSNIAVNVYQSNDNKFELNTIANNYFALWLHTYCQRNIIERNTISNNNHGGIWFMGGCLKNIISNKIYYSLFSTSRIRIYFLIFRLNSHLDIP